MGSQIAIYVSSTVQQFEHSLHSFEFYIKVIQQLNTVDQIKTFAQEPNNKTSVVSQQLIKAYYKQKQSLNIKSKPTNPTSKLHIQLQMTIYVFSKIKSWFHSKTLKFKSHIQFITWQGHNCLQKRAVLKMANTPFILLLPPEEEVLAAIDLLLKLEYTIEQCLSSWGATRHIDVHRNNAVTATHDRVRVVVVPTPICTASHRNHPPWFWHLVIDPEIAKTKSELNRSCSLWSIFFYISLRKPFS